MLGFAKRCIALRHALPVLRSPRFPNALAGPDREADITFLGLDGGAPEWAGWNRALTYRLRERTDAASPGDELMLMLNMHWENAHVQLTPAFDGTWWHVLVNTSMSAGADAFAPLDAPAVQGSTFVVGARSIVVLISGSRRRP